MIRSLDGVRGFAACWVVLYHSRFFIDAVLPGWTRFRAFVYDGYLGVDIFAILSGFVICLSYSEKLQTPSWPAVKRFLWFRIARIYPLVLFSLGLLVLVRLGRHGWENWREYVVDRSLWLQVTMLNGWGFESVHAWNVPSWTVSSEWLCYLLFPLAAPLVRTVRHGPLAGLLAMTTLAATAAAMVALGLPHFGAFLDWGALRIAGEFLTGCWLCRAYQEEWGRRLPWSAIGIVALTVAVTFGSGNALVTVFAFAVFVYALIHEPRPLEWVFGNPVARYLGAISYSIYMMHWIVVVDLAAVLRPHMAVLTNEGLVLIVVSSVFPLSALTYHLIERPSRSKLRSWAAPSPSRPATDTP